ncbi:hypothetical protein AAFF_G00220550 [Aldrovandia affinis]|uniref:Uncharacterized protein n=1 Tax=Aldrovandia affinis TaxID=143900 RepID=A0AAD7W5D2_9TELE|nr:hypothetical protein AAFF_G00220550 [Aldrovandia affinis]
MMEKQEYDVREGGYMLRFRKEMYPSLFRPGPPASTLATNPQVLMDIGGRASVRDRSCYYRHAPCGECASALQLRLGSGACLSPWRSLMLIQLQLHPPNQLQTSPPIGFFSLIVPPPLYRTIKT